MKLLRSLALFSGTALVSCAPLTNVDTLEPLTALAKRDEVTAREVFQVYGPGATYGNPIDTQQLMQNTFANSYGDPFTAKIAAPTVAFDKVSLTLDITSYGNQFDRLGHIFVNNVEVWRFSTAEPGGTNITFNYTRDVSDFLVLFQSEISLKVSLDNVMDSTYTGPFVGTLTANYYNTGSAYGSNVTSIANAFNDLQPPSAVKGLHSGVVNVPDSAYNVTIDAIPKNTTRLVLDVVASGNADEEFWYTNVMSAYTKTFSTTLAGNGPSRLVEVYVGGKLAGFAQPFPIIFTGGISPYLWLTEVGINAYDLPHYQVDLTPFLPALWENDSTVLDIKVVNGYSSSNVGSNWVISSSLKLWQVEGVEGSGTQADSVITQTPNAVANVGSNNATLFEGITLVNQLTTQATLKFSGSSYSVTWQQTGQFYNGQYVTDSGNTQRTIQTTTGTDLLSVSGGVSATAGSFTYKYPLAIQAGYESTSVENFLVEVSRGYSIASTALTVSTLQNGSSELASQLNSGSALYGFGSTEQQYLGILDGKTLATGVLAANMTVSYPDYQAGDIDAMSSTIAGLVQQVVAGTETKFDACFEGANHWSAPVQLVSRSPPADILLRRDSEEDGVLFFRPFNRPA